MSTCSIPGAAAENEASLAPEVTVLSESVAPNVRYIPLVFPNLEWSRDCSGIRTLPNSKEPFQRLTFTSFINVAHMIGLI